MRTTSGWIAAARICPTSVNRQSSASVFPIRMGQIQPSIHPSVSLFKHSMLDNISDIATETSTVKVALQTSWTQHRPNECARLSLLISRALSTPPSSARDIPSHPKTTPLTFNTPTMSLICPHSASLSIMRVCQISGQQMRELFKATRYSRNKKLCNQGGRGAPRAPPRPSALPRASPRSKDFKPTTATVAT